MAGKKLTDGLDGEVEDFDTLEQMVEEKLQEVEADLEKRLLELAILEAEDARRKGHIH